MIWVVAIVALELLVVFVYGFGTYRWRFRNILVALTQLLNAVGGGDPGETTSSRAAKQSHKRGWRLLGRFLDWIDPGHMRRSIVPDRGDDAAWR